MLNRFRPWRHVRGQVVVTAESGWRNFERQARRGEAIIVEVPGGDFFEDNHNTMVDSSGLPVFWNGKQFHGNRAPAGKWAKLSDVRARVFAIIDANPEAKFFVSTKRLEDVRGMTPEPNDGKIRDEWGSNPPSTRSNLILGTTVRTQDEADELIPKLLQLRDLCAGLWVHCEPEEEIDVFYGREHHEACDVLPAGGFWHSAECPSFCEYACGGSEYEGIGIDYLSIAGNDKPMHPDWVRLLVNRCEAAGVQVAFWGWGAWVASDPKDERYLQGGVKGGNWSRSGKWVDWDQLGESPFTIRVGPKRSGRTLDGKTYEWKVTQ